MAESFMQKWVGAQREPLLILKEAGYIPQILPNSELLQIGQERKQ